MMYLLSELSLGNKKSKLEFELLLQNPTKNSINMKKSKACLLLALAFLASSTGLTLAGPYEPEGRIVQYQQPAATPDNVSLRLRVFGDEYYARAETLDGYTVMYRPFDSTYRYAKVSADGQSLEPATFDLTSLANRLPPANVIAGGRHIDIPTSVILQNTALLRTQFDATRKARWDNRLPGSTVAAESSTGTAVGLTILVRFSDVDLPSGLDQTKVKALLNGGYSADTALPSFLNTPPATLGQLDTNVDSVYNYFKDQSSGRLDLVQYVTRPVTLGSRASYNALSSDSRTVGARIVTDAIARLLSTTALPIADPDFNDTNVLRLSADLLGRIRSVNVIVAGGDSGVSMRGIWPHTATMATRAQIYPTPVNPGDPPARFISEYHLTTAPLDTSIQSLWMSPTLNDGSFESFGAEISDTPAVANPGSANFLATTTATSAWTLARTITPAGAPLLANTSGILESNFEFTPTRVEAENFSAVSGNISNATAAGIGVGSENNLAAEDNGRSIIFIDSADWLEYTINAPVAGSYDFNFRVATNSNGATFDLRDASGFVIGTPTVAVVPNSGAFNTYRNVIVSGVNLVAGPQTIRVNFLVGPLNFNWLEFRRGGAPATTWSENSRNPATIPLGRGAGIFNHVLSTSSLLSTVTATMRNSSPIPAVTKVGDLIEWSIDINSTAITAAIGNPGGNLNGLVAANTGFADLFIQFGSGTPIKLNATPLRDDDRRPHNFTTLTGNFEVTPAMLAAGNYKVIVNNTNPTTTTILGDPGRIYVDNVKMNNISTLPVDLTQPSVVRSRITIGTFCRESMKMLFGAPDLAAFPNLGVGNQCLMGSCDSGWSCFPGCPSCDPDLQFKRRQASSSSQSSLQERFRLEHSDGVDAR
jgi:Carbohydrate binding module (family 6)